MILQPVWERDLEDEEEGVVVSPLGFSLGLGAPPVDPVGALGK